MKPLTGYRIEDFSGSGVRNPVAIITYEYNDLGNTDIQDTLYRKKLIKKPVFRDAVAFLERRWNDGYRNAIWICRKKEDVIRDYTFEGILIDSIDKYVFTDYLIISSLGSSGDLVLIGRASCRERV